MYLFVYFKEAICVWGEKSRKCICVTLGEFLIFNATQFSKDVLPQAVLPTASIAYVCEVLH